MQEAWKVGSNLAGQFSSASSIAFLALSASSAEYKVHVVASIDNFTLAITIKESMTFWMMSSSNKAEKGVCRYQPCSLGRTRAGMRRAFRVSNFLKCCM